MIITKLPILSSGEWFTTYSGLVGSSTLEYDFMGKSTWMLIVGGEQLGSIFSFFTIVGCSYNLDWWLICEGYVTSNVSMNLTFRLMHIFLMIKGWKIYTLFVSKSYPKCMCSINLESNLPPLLTLSTWTKVLHPNVQRWLKLSLVLEFFS
jgi:hypothetical protein